MYGTLEATITPHEQGFKVTVHRVLKGKRMLNSATLHMTKEKAEQFAKRKGAMIISTSNQS